MTSSANNIMCKHALVYVLQVKQVHSSSIVLVSEANVFFLSCNWPESTRAEPNRAVLVGKTQSNKSQPKAEQMTKSMPNLYKRLCY